MLIVDAWELAKFVSMIGGVSGLAGFGLLLYSTSKEDRVKYFALSAALLALAVLLTLIGTLVYK